MKIDFVVALVGEDFHVHQVNLIRCSWLPMEVRIIKNKKEMEWRGRGREGDKVQSEEEGDEEEEEGTRWRRNQGYEGKGVRS